MGADNFLQRRGEEEYLTQLKMKIAELEEALTDVVRLNDKLSACMTVAKSPDLIHVKEGDYLWSSAYQAVLELRQAYDLRTQ